MLRKTHPITYTDVAQTQASWAWYRQLCQNGLYMCQNTAALDPDVK